jgi:cysteine dioxygenase
VATDGESYTLLALVWTPARASHVHDHPCDGCWMRVLRGEVRECRYRPVLGEGEDGKAVPHLECFQDEVYREDEQAVVFIEDCLGYHKVENPSPTQPAVTLHLYSPPFDRCRVWLDKSGGGGTNSRYSSASSSCCARYDSVYGERTGGGTATRTFGAE